MRIGRYTVENQLFRQVGNTFPAGGRSVFGDARCVRGDAETERKCAADCADLPDSPYFQPYDKIASSAPRCEIDATDCRESLLLRQSSDVK